MPRPTPARILYLVIGVVLGIVLLIAGERYLLPSLTAELPAFLGGGAPPPAVATGPSQFTGGQLDRVQMVNLVQDKNGVQLRLNTLELYKDGFTISYSLTSGRGASPQTLEPETFVVSDPRNTAYTTSSLGTAAATSAGFTAGIVSFTPVPPPDVRELRVTVANAISLGLRPREAQSRVVGGPWEFQIPLQR